jgi:hypothetical protein
MPAYTGSAAFTPQQGAGLWIGDGDSPEDYTAILEVAKVSPSNRQYDIVDTTNLQSDTKEKLGGLLDSGKIDIEGNYLQDTTQQLLETAFDGTPKPFVITLPMPSINKLESWYFMAIMREKNPPEFEKGKAVKFKWGLEITGRYTFEEQDLS